MKKRLKRIHSCCLEEHFIQVFWCQVTPLGIITVEHSNKISAEIISSQSRRDAPGSSPSSSSGSSPPPHKKIRRMQVGIDSNSALQSTTAESIHNNSGTSINRSIGQRIKESATLKDHLQNGQNNNNNVHNLSASCANNNSNCVNGRTSKTAPVLNASTFTGEKQTKRLTEQINLTGVQRNTIRIIGQYLRNLGMNDTVDVLVEESGCRIENSLASCLQEYILVGAWSQALEVVEKFKSTLMERQYYAIRVLLLEEKFKLLISNNEYIAALHLLQMEYPKRDEFKERCEHLATTLIRLPILTSETCESGAFFAFENASSLISQQRASDDPAAACLNNEYVLKILHKMLPPTFLLPPNRLDELLKQSWLYQLKDCDLHLGSTNSDNIDENAIFKNHQCSSQDFPSKTSQVLYDHHAEVWCLEFSPCGKFLASGAKSQTILIWRVDGKTQQLILLSRFQVPPTDVTGIAFLSWSYDSQFLAVASSEETSSGIFVYNIERGTYHAYIQPNTSDSYSVVSFFKNKSHCLACGDQRGHFHFFDINNLNSGSPKSFEGFRIRCIYSMKDGKTVLAADTHNRVRSYDFETNSEVTVIQESSQIMYFTVDRSEKYCLITTKTEGIKLWSLKTKTLLRTFYGSSHHEFVISSSFGGFHNNFIASGSEDENIMVWNIHKSEPIMRLSGHTGTVNAVSWNPVIHGMLVSASDDLTIRVWSSQKSS